MEPRRCLLLVALTVGFSVSCAILASTAGQTPSLPPGRALTDSPYHPSDMSRPRREGLTSANIVKSAQPGRPSNSSLALLAKIAILPSSILITGPRYSQRLLVEGTFADGHQEELTSRAIVAVSDPTIVKVDKDGVAFPQGDGQAIVTATVQGHRATAPLIVYHYAAPFNWSFRNDVLPVMTKMGCNSGPCHGAAAGKNGFKLTLRGYDSSTDYYTLTHQALGRRTDPIEPARSLILLKPTLTISHGGGRRFDVGSLEYMVIAGWLAQGMPAPRDSDALVTNIQVLPREASLQPGAQQQLIVTATFSDGHTVDVAYSSDVGR